MPPAPFVNSSIDQKEFANNTLLAEESDEAQADAKHGIACLLACQSHEVAMKIFES